MDSQITPLGQRSWLIQDTVLVWTARILRAAKGFLETAPSDPPLVTAVKCECIRLSRQLLFERTFCLLAADGRADMNALLNHEWFYRETRDGFHMVIGNPDGYEAEGADPEPVPVYEGGITQAHSGETYVLTLPHALSVLARQHDEGPPVWAKTLAPEYRCHVKRFYTTGANLIAAWAVLVLAAAGHTEQIAERLGQGFSLKCWKTGKTLEAPFQVCFERVNPSERNNRRRFFGKTSRESDD